VTGLPHLPYSPHLAPWFLIFSLLERKATWVPFSVGQVDRHFHKGSNMGPSCKYFSAVFPAAIPTLADLQRGQWWLSWGRLWICVSVCEYLVIWCNKSTVHEILDCSIEN
jgi:hypothetical protein